MKYKLIVPGYCQDSCRNSKVSLLFDEQHRLLNPRTLARSSMVGWGPWQSSAKVETKWGPAWFVTTAGHGGYILVSQTKGLPGYLAFTVERERGNAYVYEFEEDTAWAILEYLDENVREWAVKRLYRNTSVEKRLESVIATLRECHPDILNASL